MKQESHLEWIQSLITLQKSLNIISSLDGMVMNCLSSATFLGGFSTKFYRMKPNDLLQQVGNMRNVSHHHFPWGSLLLQLDTDNDIGLTITTIIY